MNTQMLETFVALAKCCNFSQTADMLFVAQSTVTKRIAELEKEVGCTLFHRNNKKVEISNEGLFFLQFAKRMLELEKSSVMAIHSHQNYEQYLRIGAPNFLYESYLEPLLSQIMEKNIAVKIMLGHSSEMLQLLQDDVLDVVYSCVPCYKSGFCCEEFQKDTFVLVTNYENTEHKNGIKKEQLCQVKYLMCNFSIYEVGNYVRGLFPEYHQFKFEIDNSSRLLEYMLKHGGYSFLPNKMADAYIKSKKLRIIPVLDIETPTIQSYCIYRENKSKLALLR